MFNSQLNISELLRKMRSRTDFVQEWSNSLAASSGSAMCSLFICNTGEEEGGGLPESLCIRLHIQCFLKNWLKMRICKIGLINFMVILVIYYTSYNKEKYSKT